MKNAGGCCGIDIGMRRAFVAKAGVQPDELTCLDEDEGNDILVPHMSMDEMGSSFAVGFAHIHKGDECVAGLDLLV